MHIHVLKPRRSFCHAGSVTIGDEFIGCCARPSCDAPQALGCTLLLVMTCCCCCVCLPVNNTLLCVCVSLEILVIIEHSGVRYHARPHYNMPALSYSHSPRVGR